MTSDRLPADLRKALDAALAPHAAAQDSRDAALLLRVRERLLQALATPEVPPDPAATHHTVRAQDGEWEQIAPGVSRKRLHQAGGVLSCLVRMAPGGRVPGHLHGIDEECVVLQGSLEIGDALTLHAGDFHLGAAGTAHADATTRTGALVYLRTAA